MELLDNTQVISDYSSFPTIKLDCPIILDTSKIDIEISDSEEKIYNKLKANYDTFDVNVSLVKIFQSKKKTKSNLSYLMNIYEISDAKARKMIDNGSKYLGTCLDGLDQYLSDFNDITSKPFTVSLDTLNVIKNSTLKKTIQTKIDELCDKSKDSLTTKPVRVMDIDVHFYYIWLRAIKHYGYQVTIPDIDFEGTSIYSIIAKHLAHGSGLSKAISMSCNHEIWPTVCRLEKDTLALDLAIAKLQYYASKPRTVGASYPMALGMFLLEHHNTMILKKLGMIHAAYFRPSSAVIDEIKEMSEEFYHQLLQVEYTLIDH